GQRARQRRLARGGGDELPEPAHRAFLAQSSARWTTLNRGGRGGRHLNRRGRGGRQLHRRGRGGRRGEQQQLLVSSASSASSAVQCLPPSRESRWESCLTGSRVPPHRSRRRSTAPRSYTHARRGTPPGRDGSRWISAAR